MPMTYLGDVATAGLTNQYPMRAILMACQDMDMTMNTNVASLLYNIVNYFRIFEIVLSPLNSGTTFTGVGVNELQEITLSYSSALNQVVIKVNNITQTSISAANVKSTLVAMLNNASHYTFNLSVPNTDTNEYTLQRSMAQDFWYGIGRERVLCSQQIQSIEMYLANIGIRFYQHAYQLFQSSVRCQPTVRRLADRSYQYFLDRSTSCLILESTRITTT
jgi:hypothetical protein